METPVESQDTILRGDVRRNLRRAFRQRLRQQAFLEITLLRVLLPTASKASELLSVAPERFYLVNWFLPPASQTAFPTSPLHFNRLPVVFARTD